MKRITAILLALMLTLGMTAYAAPAETDAEADAEAEEAVEEAEHYRYTVKDGVLVGYEADEGCGDAVVPEDVTEIGYKVFALESGLKSVTLPEGVTKIASRAFAYCEDLETVVLPSTIEYIGDYAFAGCTALRDIECPEDVEFGGEHVFLGCTALGTTDDAAEPAEEDPSAEHVEEDESEQSAETDAQPSEDEEAEPSAEPEPAKPLAYANTVSVRMDDKYVQFKMYKLVDENGNDTNYVRLRDLAYLVNGTGATFEIIYTEENDSISLLPGQHYYPIGNEMNTPFSGDREYQKATATVWLNGVEVVLDAILLTDDNAGGYNYFKLRDMGRALDFNVGYNNMTGEIFVETYKSYVEDN